MTDRLPSPAAGAAETPATVLASRGLVGWMAEQDCAIVLTTHQAGRLVFVGARLDGALRVHERMIPQCQGLWTDGRSLWTSGKWALWRFENDLADGQTLPGGVDRRFVPASRA